jgi:thymidylate synthase (FAD)
MKLNYKYSEPKAKLVAYSQPAEEFKDQFSDIKELVSYCARVSNPDNQLNMETADKLINYLIKNKHYSPFEMASITVELETTRDIARQLLRHRSFTFQEFSQRYADPTESLGFVLREARLQDTKNRQNSLEITTDGEDDRFLISEWERRQKDVLDLVNENYSWAISCGIAKEQARSILPEGNTVSRLYVQGTIRSFIHYLELRCGNGTQKEHQELAFCLASAIQQVFKLE